MPLSTVNLPWLNHNSQRAYPLSESVTREDQSGDFTLPDDLILALYFPIHAGLSVSVEKFYLQSVAVFPTGLSVSLGYDDNSEAPPTVATALVPLATHAEYKSYRLVGEGDFEDCVGKVVIGAPDAVRALPGGLYVFDPAAAYLDTDCIRPSARGLSSLSIRSGGETSRRYYGDVELVAGTNFRLTVSTVDGVQKVRLDAISGEGLNQECDCAGATPTSVIRTINNIPPKANGDFTLGASNCTEVTSVTGGVKFRNTCSQPCCGCPELEVLTSRMEKFGAGAVTLQNFANRLESQSAIFNSVVLGSKLGDAPCGA